MAVGIDVANLGSFIDATGVLTVAFTTTGAVVPGGFVVLGVGAIKAADTTFTVSGVADDSVSPLQWTVDKQGHAATVLTTVLVAIVSAPAPAGLASGTTVTATFTQAPENASIGGSSFVGVAAVSPVDGTPVGPTVSEAAEWTTDNMVVQAGSVMVATSFNQNTSLGNTATAPSIELWDAADLSDDLEQATEYRIEALGGTYTVAGTWGAAQANSTIGVAYKQQSADVPHRHLTRHSRMTSW